MNANEAWPGLRVRFVDDFGQEQKWYTNPNAHKLAGTQATVKRIFRHWCSSCRSYHHSICVDLDKSTDWPSTWVTVNAESLKPIEGISRGN